jgi:hypothetical protein
MRSRHEELSSERVGLLLLLPARIGIWVAHEVPKLMGRVKAAPSRVPLVATEDDDWARSLGVAEGVDALVRNLQSCHDDSVRFQVPDQVADGSVRQAPCSTEFGRRLGELRLVGVWPERDKRHMRLGEADIPF